MHRSDLDNVPHLFAFEDAVSSTASHPGNIQQLSTVDHVVVCQNRQNQVQTIAIMKTNPLVLQRTRPLPPLENTDCPRPPKELQ